MTSFTTKRTEECGPEAHEPGEPIWMGKCACCNANLTVFYGDDPGEISVIGTPDKEDTKDTKDDESPCPDYIPGTPNPNAECYGDGQDLCSTCAAWISDREVTP